VREHFQCSAGTSKEVSNTARALARHAVALAFFSENKAKQAVHILLGLAGRFGVNDLTSHTLEFAQQRLPALRTFAVTVLKRDQLFRSVESGADQHQGTQTIVF
jgi:hypothetical protein